MDVMVCREVLTHLIEECEILGSDADSIPKWKAILAKMPPYRTTEDGTHKEWGWPGLDENYDQRHVSHLYRSEEHTYELQSLMRHSYALFCMKTTKIIQAHATI